MISSEKAIVTVYGAEAIPIDQNQTRHQERDNSVKHKKNKQSVDARVSDATIGHQTDNNVTKKPSSVLVEERYNQ